MQSAIIRMWSHTLIRLCELHYERRSIWVIGLRITGLIRQLGVSNNPVARWSYRN